ncbi:MULTISPECIES: glutamate synthase-related protein [unclassified Sedimentibacter]|uniref:glutamate synthase-related protein n=1 Tax=unclassified Sedimentibacter TaxID=2649220 RepID=UPI0027DF45A7|nr:glutamate synthase-related protein [Sedimentibacter sp. MB35-C1]WMJ76488.1 glutamate synthase-related protein [Sedimentibacter sp. MB35-C1]
MSFSPSLGSTLTHTAVRTPENVSEYSGMCAVCTANCIGPCEIGLSAIRGCEALYPFETDKNQFASEKRYPLDFSHFNINGKVFGAYGCEENADSATYPKVDIQTSFGLSKKVKMNAPIILPAMAKLNWKDYYAGAALAGVPVVIGEDVVAKDKELALENGKVVSSPLIMKMVDSFREYYRGYGDIILQANYDDENLGVLDYAIKSLGVKSVELKFGQAAKGIQGMGAVKDIDDAVKLKKMGYLVYPDPEDPNIAENYKKGKGQIFEKIGKLPIWNEELLINRVAELRKLGAERICFKTGPFDPKDLVRIIKIASEAGVDLITFDGAGGGTGNSPVKMMNEWGMPTVYLESMLYNLLSRMKYKNFKLPQIAIAGGFATEDHIFKGLALGAPVVNFVAVGRAAMAAAMSGKQVDELLSQGIVTKEYKRFGSERNELFAGIRELKMYYDNTDKISGGAIGVYSYISRVSAGLKQLMALNRKFKLGFIERGDIIPLTELAAQVSGLDTYDDLLLKELSNI